jgi:hypothetical protein
MTSPAWHGRAAREEAGKHETAAEAVPAEVSMPVPALPSRPAPTGVRAAAPHTARRLIHPQNVSAPPYHPCNWLKGHYGARSGRAGSKRP